MASKLILTRKAEWFNRSQTYKVFINQNQVGSIKNGDTQEFELEPGVHNVQCKHNWMSSPVTTVIIQNNVNSYLQVSNGMKYIVPLYIILLAGILFPLFFKLSGTPLPEATSVIKMIMIFPGLIYIILYLSVLRKKYLNLGEDGSNPFK